MKQTNNAIKFLMAQYRAIFKNAYFKGMASALLLTAGLAVAGNAQAAAVTSAQLAGTEEIEVNGSGTTLSGALDDLGSSWNAPIKVTSGANTTNALTQTENVTISGSGSLTIETTANATDGVKITAADGKELSISINALNVNKGTLTIEGGATDAKNATFSANTISLGQADGTVGDAKVTLNKAGQSGAVTIGSNTSTISLAKTAEVVFAADAAADAVLAGSLQATGGKLNFSGAGTLKTYTTGNTGATVNVEVAGEQEAVLNLDGASGSNLKLAGGTFNVNSHGTTGATFTVQNGTLEIGDDVSFISSGSAASGGIVKLDAKDAAGTNAVSADQAVLKLSSEKLNTFLTDGTNTKAGVVNIAKGTVELTDNVDLYKVFGNTKLVASATANTGEIVVGSTVGNSFITGNELTISQSLGAGAAGVTVKANTLNLTEQATGGLGVGETVAEKYVLKLVSGSTADNAYTVDKVHSYAAVLENQPNPFYDANDGTNFADANKTVNLAGTGTIDNSLIVSGSTAEVNVYAGHYTDNHDITLASGALSVGGVTSANHPEYAGIDASLTLSGNQLILDNTSGNNTITVAGNSGNVAFGSSSAYTRPATAVLDLTGAGLTIKGHASNLSQFNVNANGILRITTEQALDILNTHRDRTASGAGILISGGRVEVAGDLYDRDATIKGISVTKLVSGSAATVATDTIAFSGAGSTLAADSITLYSTDEANQTLDIGAGELEAESITLNQNALDSTTHRPLDFNVKSGVLNVGSSLNGSANQIVLGVSGTSSADVNLGYITKDVDPTHGIRADLTTYTTSADTGSVNVDLKLDGKEAYVTGQSKDTSDLNIFYGEWTVQDITATNATITVGSTSEEKDANGELYTASLSGQGLTLGAGTHMDVRSNGAAEFETLSLNGATVTVDNTTLTINGVYQAEVEDDPATTGVNEAKDEAWGLVTSAGTISVNGRKGQLILGAEAVQGITTTLTDGKYVYDNANKAQNAFVDLNDWATLNLDLSSDVTFDANSLASLRNNFIVAGSLRDGLVDEGFINIGGAKIAGINTSNGTISWNGQNGAPGLKDYSDIIADILQNDLRNAVLVDVGASDTVQANVGAIVVDGSANSVRLNDTNLYNAAANNGNFFSNEDTTGPIDAIVEDGAHVSLNNGGNTGAIQLSDGTTGTTELAVVSSAAEDATAPVTTIENLRGLGDNTSFEVSGVTNITRNLEIGTLEVNDALTINGTTTISNGLTSREDADGNLVTTGSLNAVGALTVEGGVDYAGNITASGTATFGAADGSDTDSLGNLNEYYFAGNNTFKNVNLYNGAEFDRGVTTAETMTIGDGMEIYGGASVNANVLQFTANTTDKWISVGEPADKDKATGEERESSNGYLTVGRLDLAGNTLVTDPDWSKPASIVAIGQLGSDTAVTSALGNDAGTLNGALVALQNSILAVGVTDSTEADGDTAIEQIQQTFATYLNDNGALSADGVGAIAYVAKAMNLGADDKIVVDASRNAKQYQDLMDVTNTNPSTEDTAFRTAVNTNNAYIGANSVLAFGNDALNATSTDGTTTIERAALHFDDDNASIYGAGGKIVLTGGEFNTIDKVLLFTDKGTGEHAGVLIAADGQDIRVESLSGLYYMT